MQKKPSSKDSRNTYIIFASLFTSLGTLLCCALPALLVSLGLGSVMLSLVTSLPWIVAIGEHKLFVFLISGFLLTLSSVFVYQAKFRPCPIDPAQRHVCLTLRKFNQRTVIGSWIIWWIGFVMSYLV